HARELADLAEVLPGRRSDRRVDERLREREMIRARDRVVERPRERMTDVVRRELVRVEIEPADELRAERRPVVTKAPLLVAGVKRAAARGRVEEIIDEPDREHAAD